MNTWCTLNMEALKLFFFKRCSDRTWCRHASSPSMGKLSLAAGGGGGFSVAPHGPLSAPQSGCPAPAACARWRQRPAVAGGGHRLPPAPPTLALTPPAFLQGRCDGVWHPDAAPAWEPPAGPDAPLVKTKPGRRSELPADQTLPSCSSGRPRAASVPPASWQVLPGAAVALGRGCSRPGAAG